MPFNENRPLAWAVLAACALGSVFGLGGNSLARERDRVVDYFYDGAETTATTRSSMDAYLDRAAECAQVMASEVQLHLGADDANAQKMLDALADFGDDDGLDARYAAYQTLQGLSDQLYNEMYAANLSDTERVNFKHAYDDFWGCDKYVRIDPYRSMAAEFNDSLDGFPASLAAGLWGVDELNSFGA